MSCTVMDSFTLNVPIYHWYVFLKNSELSGHDKTCAYSLQGEGNKKKTLLHRYMQWCKGKVPHKH